MKDDSEYLAAWQEPDDAKPTKAPEQAKPEQGFMDKLGVIGKTLLKNNTPRTNTVGTFR